MKVEPFHKKPAVVGQSAEVEEDHGNPTSDLEKYKEKMTYDDLSLFVTNFITNTNFNFLTRLSIDLE